MTTKSPVSEGRSTVCRRARRSRRASSSASSCSGGDLRLTEGGLDAEVGPQAGLRQHSDLDREAQGLALRRQLPEVHLGVPDRHDPGALDRVGIPAGERLADGLLEHRLAPHPLDHHRRGDLPAAEARELEVASELSGGSLQALLDLVGRHLHLDPHARVAQLGDLCVQRYGHAATIPCGGWRDGRDFRLRAAWRRGSGRARRVTSSAARSTSRWCWCGRCWPATARRRGPERGWSRTRADASVAAPAPGSGRRRSGSPPRS